MTTLTKEEVRSLHRRSLVLGTSIFLFDYLGFLAASVATVLVQSVWLQVSLSFVAGLFISGLHVVAHDACHMSLVPQRWLNRLIGTLSFLPSLYAVSLWQRSHNRKHHHFTNILGKDGVWEPLTLNEYRRLSKAGQFRYRFYRTFVGHFWYAMFEVWLKKLFFPRASEIGGYRKRYVVDLAIVTAWMVMWPTLLFVLRSNSGAETGCWEDLRVAIALGFGYPLLISHLINSATIFLHHTHPHVEWYTPAQAAGVKNIGLRKTVHVVFPPPIEIFLQGIMDHTAHHALPGVPLYQVPECQRLLESRSSEIVVEKWSLAMHLRNLRCCKLFDTERRCWTDYAGRPVLSAERQPLPTVVDQQVKAAA